MEMKDKIIKQVTNYYLKSGDFNGTPIKDLKLADNDLSLIEELIKEGVFIVNYGDRHPNPHILAFEPETVEILLEKLKRADLTYACLYPTRKHLAMMIDKQKYAGRPFELMMALGAPQLSFRPFDLSVLEHYRNDPRYSFECDDIHGSLSIKSQFSENGKVYKRDAVFIQTFGFAYNKTLTKRAVAVFIRYLADLSSEHQQLWFNKMLKGKYSLHPDYLAAVFDRPEPTFRAEMFKEYKAHGPTTAHELIS